MRRTVALGAAGASVARIRPTRKAPTPTARTLACTGPDIPPGRAVAAGGHSRPRAPRARNRAVRTGAGPPPATPRSRGRAVRAAHPAATARTAARGAATAGWRTAGWLLGAPPVT